MRKITVNASKAFWDNGYFKQDNTIVLNGVMQLYRTNIATYADSTLTLNTDGWYSNTTKERLNGVLANIGAKIFQKNFQWYVLLNDGNVIDFNDGIEIKL